MHSKRMTLPMNKQLGDEAERQATRPGLSGELGSALMDFARRLANFGLGELDGPILDEFVERRRQPRLPR